MTDPDMQVLARPGSLPNHAENEKPLSVFTGKDEDWPEWAFEARAEFVCRGLLSDDDINEIEHAGNPLPMPQDQSCRDRSSRVYHLLARACKGPSNLVLRKVQRGNGCEAWRLLHIRYDRLDSDSSLDVLGCILDFDFGDGKDLEDRVNRFDILLQTYNLANLEELAEDVVKSIFLKRLPHPLKGQLELQVDVSTSLAAVKSKISDYLRHHRTFKPSYVVPGAEAVRVMPMELDQVVPFTAVPGMKGKGKGKGKKGKGKAWWTKNGKGGDDRQAGQWIWKPANGIRTAQTEDDSDEDEWDNTCWVCGGFGHKANECPTRRRRADRLGHPVLATQQVNAEPEGALRTAMMSTGSSSSTSAPSMPGFGNQFCPTDRPGPLRIPVSAVEAEKCGHQLGNVSQPVGQTVGPMPLCEAQIARTAERKMPCGNAKGVTMW